MSSGKPRQRSDEEARQYLSHVLKLNPTRDADRMVLLRWRFNGFRTRKTTTAIDPAVRAKKRERIEKQLESIRGNFWRINAVQLREALDGLSARDFPDLKAGIDRLKLLSLYREDLQAVGKHAEREMNLYNTFRRVIMSPPRKAGQLKEKYLRDFAFSENRKKVFTMLNMLRKQYPEVYKIESDWFDQISQIKRRTVESNDDDGIDYGGVDFEIPIWLIGIILFIIARVAFIILRSSY